MNTQVHIKQYRKDIGLTQQMLAESLGVTQGMIHLVEKGERTLGKRATLLLHRLDPERFPLEKMLCPDCSSGEQGADMGDVGSDRVAA